MCNIERMALPTPDMHGGAGTLNPMDREVRYKGYTEKLHEKGSGGHGTTANG